jgi:hypothetical protein
MDGASADQGSALQASVTTSVRLRETGRLVGSTGIFCVPTEKPRCVPNHNPASIFSSGKSFKALWVESIASSNSSSNTYSLMTCEEVGGSWYVYIGPGS